MKGVVGIQEKPFAWRSCRRNDERTAHRHVRCHVPARLLGQLSGDPASSHEPQFWKSTKKFGKPSGNRQRTSHSQSDATNRLPSPERQEMSIGSATAIENMKLEVTR